MSSLLVRGLVLLASILMPAISVLSQRGAFGPDNATISNRYPTLLIASGYAFAIWGLIFLGDLAFGVFQAARPRDEALERARPYVLAGFALTAAWMPIFSRQVFWLSTLVIWGATFSLLRATFLLRGEAGFGRQALGSAPLSLHAGWISLAAFLQTAQLIEAYQLVSADQRVSVSLALFGLAGVLLMGANRLMRGNVVFVAAALWGLSAVAHEQHLGRLAGAEKAQYAAIFVAILLLLDTVWLVGRRHWSAEPPAARGSFPILAAAMAPWLCRGPVHHRRSAINHGQVSGRRCLQSRHRGLGRSPKRTV